MMFGYIVEDAAAEEKRLRAEGVEIVRSVRDEDYGQRHFFALDPNGILLDVIEPIQPTPEWLAAKGLA
ncbi:MAG: hypothetical protein JWQ81_1886 [Amycolatopsis sp.]|nr:hypothetical protein [Amycolatopsis sp.]